MERMRGDGMQVGTVGVSVLLVTAFGPLPIDDLLKALTHVGAPSWQPVGEVVIASVERLLGQHQIGRAHV